MTILVTGATGFIGSRLARGANAGPRLSDCHVEVVQQEQGWLNG